MGIPCISRSRLPTLEIQVCVGQHIRRRYAEWVLLAMDWTARDSHLVGDSTRLGPIYKPSDYSRYLTVTR